MQYLPFCQTKKDFIIRLSGQLLLKYVIIVTCLLFLCASQIFFMEKFPSSTKRFLDVSVFRRSVGDKLYCHFSEYVFISPSSLKDNSLVHNFRLPVIFLTTVKISFLVSIVTGKPSAAGVIVIPFRMIDIFSTCCFGDINVCVWCSTVFVHPFIPHLL